MGKTWKYVASELPPIDGGQRLVLMRLNEGPLLLVSLQTIRNVRLWKNVVWNLKIKMEM